jgi:hypothetical protein
MTTFLVRLGFGFTLACLMSGLAGCVDRPIHAMTKPSFADFSIAFAGAPQPTSMSITPDEGDVWLQVVKTPGPKDNRVTWQSNQKFSIRFGQLDDPNEPLKPGKRLGNEKQDWNDASEKNGAWEYTLTLSQGAGRGRETIAAKYFVKHVDSGVVFDPVIIVGR